jgi:hypothetical protein
MTLSMAFRYVTPQFSLFICAELLLCQLLNGQSIVATANTVICAGTSRIV